jgi:Mrp family chromosome partitioning ATPase
MPPTLSPASTWIAARARNAMRRTGLMATVGLLLFLVALIVLALVPRGAVRAAQAKRLRAGTVVDTLPLLASAERWRTALGDGERRLAAARIAARERIARKAAADSARGAALAVAGIAPEQRPRADSLTLVATTLEQLIARAETAPLPTSYRAIGESWAMRGDPRVAALLDTLTSLEREREGFDAAGSADPAFVAISTRLNEIGRELQQIAASRRAGARATLAALTVQPVVVVAPVDDTTPQLLVIADARGELAVAEAELVRVRQGNAVVVRRLAEAQREISSVAPAMALAAASLVLGIVGAFVVSLAVEMRRPRLADSAEAARVTGARVLATILPPDDDDDERARRSADRDTPPLLDPTFEGYRTLYLQVAATGATIPLVTVTGDEPDVTAVVAANLAAASGFEARETLLVDGDLENGLVAKVMRVPREPGLSAILMGDEEWARAIVSTPVGRNRYVDAIPAGRPPQGPATRERAERVRRDLARYASRYDLCVLCAPSDLPEHGDRALLPTPDVILCAREGHTPLARLAEMADSLRGAGTRLRGVVVWAADVPRLDDRGVQDLAARREMSWTEMREAVARR